MTTTTPDPDNVPINNEEPEYRDDGDTGLENEPAADQEDDDDDAAATAGENPAAH